MGLLSSIVIVALVGLLAATGPAAVPAAVSPPLNAAASYSVLAGSTVTNTGLSTVQGDLGVSPGTAITGFPPGIVGPPGTIHAADAHAAAAQAAVTVAFGALSQACNTVLTGQDLGGMTLAPGVYCFNTSAQLTGQLTLDAQGDPAAVWVFQMGSTLTTASSSSVSIINNGGNSDLACNVWWQVGSSATLDTGTAFVGNVLAVASITMNTGANLEGRALAQTGAATLDTNAITTPCGGPTAVVLSDFATGSGGSLPLSQSTVVLALLAVLVLGATFVSRWRKLA